MQQSLDAAARSGRLDAMTTMLELILRLRQICDAGCLCPLDQPVEAAALVRRGCLTLNP